MIKGRGSVATSVTVLMFVGLSVKPVHTACVLSVTTEPARSFGSTVARWVLMEFLCRRHSPALTTVVLTARPLQSLASGQTAHAKTRQMCVSIDEEVALHWQGLWGGGGGGGCCEFVPSLSLTPITPPPPPTPTPNCVLKCDPMRLTGH